MELKNSEIRRIVLAEHSNLRKSLDELEQVLDSVDRHDPGARELCKGKWTQFARFFLNHLDHEDKLLRPVLKDIDAWADVRVNHLDTDHVKQRAEVAELAALIGRDPRSAVPLLRTFMKELVVDMQDEERFTLDESFLRDDPLPLDGFSG